MVAVRRSGALVGWVVTTLAAGLVCLGAWFGASDKLDAEPDTCRGWGGGCLLDAGSQALLNTGVFVAGAAVLALVGVAVRVALRHRGSAERFVLPTYCIAVALLAALLATTV